VAVGVRDKLISRDPRRRQYGVCRRLVPPHHVKVVRFALPAFAQRAKRRRYCQRGFHRCLAQHEPFRRKVGSLNLAVGDRAQQAYSLMRKKKEDISMKTRFGDEDTTDNPESSCRKKSKGDLFAPAFRNERRASRGYRPVYYHDKSVEEVALIVGAPEGTVKTRMFHARRTVGIGAGGGN